MEGLRALIRAAGQQRLCRPWEKLQGSSGSAGPEKGCRVAKALQALGGAAGQHRLYRPWQGLQGSNSSAGPAQVSLILHCLVQHQLPLATHHKGGFSFKLSWISHISHR